MIRSMMVLAASLALSGLVGCDNAMDEQKKATAAQNEANDKVAAATRESAKKAADAQLEADKKIAQAQADFMKMREDFRHNLSQSLVELDKKVALLEAKAKHAEGKTKLDLEENGLQMVFEGVEAIEDAVM